MRRTTATRNATELMVTTVTAIAVTEGEMTAITELGLGDVGLGDVAATSDVTLAAVGLGEVAATSDVTLAAVGLGEVAATSDVTLAAVGLGEVAATSDVTLAAASADPDAGESVKAVVRKRLVVTAVLIAALATVVVAVPGLRPVIRAVERVDPWWIAVGVLLEIASCVSFVVVFRLFFEQLPTVPAHELAWTEMGSGALLPGGGIGSLAVGGWLLHRAGMPTRRIVTRSSALFFYTSATSVAAMVGGAVLLATGLSHGSGGILKAGGPIVAGVLVTLAALSIPPLLARVQRAESRAGELLKDTAEGITEAERFLRHPTWRSLGAVGYLGFDIAVLWGTLYATGYHVPIATLLLGYVIGYMANLLPVPGSIGVLEGGIAGTLILYGAPAAPAAAGVLIYHAISFWVPASGGVLGYVLLRRRMERHVSAGPPADEIGTASVSSAC